MSEDRVGELVLSPGQYRWVDRVSKLLGVALIAAGLEVGGDTTVGIVLAALGVTIGIATVLIDKQ